MFLKFEVRFILHLSWGGRTSDSRTPVVLSHVV